MNEQTKDLSSSNKSAGLPTLASIVLMLRAGFLESSLPALLISSNGRVIEANQAAIELLGRGSDELPELDMHGWVANTTRLDKTLVSVEETGGGRLELDLLMGNNNPMPAELTLFTLAQSASGPVIGLVVRDLSKRRKLDEELRSRARQHALIAALGEHAFAGVDPSALIQKSAEGLSESLSVARVGIWEYRSDEGDLVLRAGTGWETAVVGTTAVGLGLASYPGFILERGRSVAMPDARAEHRFETEEFLHAEGVVAALGVVIGGNPTAFGVLAVYASEHRNFSIHDVHLIHGVANLIATALSRFQAEEESRLLEERLFQSQRLESVGRLAGGVAHDFNNLLAVVLSSARFALDEVPEDCVAAEDIRSVLEAGKRASALTRQLLVFSRRKMVAPSAVDMTHLITELEPILRRTIPATITLNVEHGLDAGCILADPGQVEQVLMNLVINARDAMGEESGQLSVTTQRRELDEDDTRLIPELDPGRYIKLEVEDSGCGMTKEVVERVFEPFFTTKEVGKGTGLGLATVYGIVQAAGGHILVNSTPGIGTIFQVFFPLADSEVGASVADGSEKVALTGGKERILLVEDEELLRKVMMRQLTRAGYQVVGAANGQKALAWVEEVGIDGLDLLVTDLEMPLVSGRELAQRLLAKKANLRIVYVTGFSEQVALLDPDGTGQVMTLNKPVSEPDFLRAIRESLDADLAH
jgi:signal transduction histidine kinase/CheY-like chemotaxis protein